MVLPPSVRKEPSEAERERARAREQARRAREAEAARERAEEARRRAAAARREQAASTRLARGEAQGQGAAPSRAAPGGGSTEASAAWRGRIVALLRSRFAGGAAGIATVNFSVTRGGQLVGARLAASSGDARLDAAALGAARGAVPPPPADYAGALNFNVRLGVR